MDDVDALQIFDLRKIQAERLESAFEFFLGPVRDFGPGFSSANVQLALVGVLRSPTMHLNVDFFGHFPAQVLDVDSGASIHLRRIFARKQADSHSSGLRSNPKLMPVELCCQDCNR